MNIYVKMWCF